MATVLLGLARFDAFQLDSQSHPPDRQRTQPLDRARRERTAVIGAQPCRQAILSEDPFETLLGALRLGAPHRFTAEQITAMKIGNGEGIAVLCVSHAELPFVVRTPQLIRTLDVLFSKRGIGMIAPPFASLLHQP